jgi:hypothetical protein
VNPLPEQASLRPTITSKVVAIADAADDTRTEVGDARTFLAKR